MAGKWSDRIGQGTYKGRNPSHSVMDIMARGAVAMVTSGWCGGDRAFQDGTAETKQHGWLSI